MLKNILDKGLGKKWQLTQEESASVWDSVSKSLGSAPKTEKKGGFLYWAGAAVAAAFSFSDHLLLFKPHSSQKLHLLKKLQPWQRGAGYLIHPIQMEPRRRRKLRILCWPMLQNFQQMAGMDLLRQLKSLSYSQTASMFQKSSL